MRGQLDFWKEARPPLYKNAKLLPSIQDLARAGKYYIYHRLLLNSIKILPFCGYFTNGTDFRPDGFSVNAL